MRYSFIVGIGVLLPTVLSLIISSSFQCAYACSCIEKKPVPEALSEAKAVFVGNVTDMLYSQNEGKIRFEVQKAWKGVDEKVVTLNADEGTCSFSFTKGKQYLVYAYNKNVDPSNGKEQQPAILSTNICLRTAAIENAESDLLSLGDGYVPSSSTNSPEFTPNERGIVVGGIDRATLYTLVGVAAVVAVGFVVIKKMRSEKQ